MEYIRETLNFKIENPTAITLGKFDGLHRGHELLMDNLMKISKEENLKSVAFTFDMAPTYIVANKEPEVLTTNEEKYYIFEKTGLDYLIECPFTKEVMNMEPEKFIKWLVNDINVRYFVVGNDFHFGHNRKGDYHVLKKFAAKYGYKVLVLDKMQDEHRDISSTYIREEVVKGNIKKVNELLGYDFFVKSVIIHGNQIGRTVGIPTINMSLPKEKLLPPKGVYVTTVLLDDKTYRGVTNIGNKPTISENNPLGVETFILDFSQDVYGKEAVVSFHDFVRPEMKFDSLEKLKEQMERDVEFARKWS
ncbi:riboflavin kinase / FMN adenylyltransferase [Lachnospiraceae bacterium C7]|nr:riboflavin kinase / FMN adenylyltransferase [Lachnospiraceae bacterium C7]